MADSMRKEWLEHFKITRDAVGSSSNQWQRDNWVKGAIIGRGAYGAVYVENNSRTGKARAVKEIRKQSNDRTWEAELIALTRLSKPAYEEYFAQFLGWYTDEWALYLVMEYFELGDLRRYMTAPLPEDEARDIIFQIFLGLQAMHADGFTHRDLKPENIFVVRNAPDWHVKVGDFGVSKRTQGEMTALRTRQIGTWAYMAPEMDFVLPQEFESSIYQNTVDVWAAGIILHEMLCTSRPFSDFGLLERYCQGKSAFPEDFMLSHGVSQAGRDTVKQLLTASPSQRLNVDATLEAAWFDLRDSQRRHQPIMPRESEDLSHSRLHSASKAGKKTLKATANDANSTPANVTGWPARSKLAKIADRSVKPDAKGENGPKTNDHSIGNDQIGRNNQSERPHSPEILTSSPNKDTELSQAGRNAEIAVTPWRRVPLTFLDPLTTDHRMTMQRWKPAVCPADHGSAYVLGGVLGLGESEAQVVGDTWQLELREEHILCTPVEGHGPPKRCGHAAAIYGGAIVIVGGAEDRRISKHPQRNVDLLDLSRGSWRWSGYTSYEHRVSSHTIVVVGHVLYSYGGYQLNRSKVGIWWKTLLDIGKSLHFFNLDDLLRPGGCPSWRYLGIRGQDSAPEPRACHTMVMHRGRIIIYGGDGNRDNHNNIWSFNPETRSWERLYGGSRGGGRTLHTATIIGDSMYVYGGRSTPSGFLTGSKTLDDLCVFHLPTRVWKRLKDYNGAPPPRCGHIMFASGTRLIILGGNMEDDLLGVANGQREYAWVLDVAQDLVWE